MPLLPERLEYTIFTTHKVGVEAIACAPNGLVLSRDTTEEEFFDAILELLEDTGVVLGDILHIACLPDNTLVGSHALPFLKGRNYQYDADVIAPQVIRYMNRGF